MAAASSCFDPSRSFRPSQFSELYSYSLFWLSFHCVYKHLAAAAQSANATFRLSVYFLSLLLALVSLDFILLSSRGWHPTFVSSSFMRRYIPAYVGFLCLCSSMYFLFRRIFFFSRCPSLALLIPN